MRQGTGGTAER